MEGYVFGIVFVSHSSSSSILNLALYTSFQFLSTITILHKSFDTLETILILFCLDGKGFAGNIHSVIQLDQNCARVVHYMVLCVISKNHLINFFMRTNVKHRPILTKEVML